MDLFFQRLGLLSSFSNFVTAGFRLSDPVRGGVFLTPRRDTAFIVTEKNSSFLEKIRYNLI